MKILKRDNRKAFIVAELAAKHNVTPRYIYMVLKSERENEEILSDYIEMMQATNLLLEAVKKVIPFNK